jgi:hypothetical protein
MFKYLAAFALPCVFSLSVPAQEKLAWDFAKNEKFVLQTHTTNQQRIWYLQTVTSAEETARQAGTLMACGTQSPLHCVPLQWLGARFVEGKQTLQHDAGFSFEVMERTDKGVVLSQKIIEARMNREGITSNNPLAPKLKDIAWTIKLGPANEITNVDSYDEIIKAATKDVAEKDRDKEAAKLRSVLSEAAMKASAEQIFAVLPTSAVKPGDTWEGPEVVEELPGIGQLRRQTTYKYEGKADFRVGDREHSGEHISFRSTLKLNPPTVTAGSGSSGSGALFQVVLADLEFEQASGDIYFDPEKRRVATVEGMTRFKGMLVLRFADSSEEPKPCFVEQEIKRVLRVVERQPKPPTP